jgi:hypothetical protein
MCARAEAFRKALADAVNDPIPSAPQCLHCVHIISVPGGELIVIGRRRLVIAKFET